MVDNGEENTTVPSISYEKLSFDYDPARGLDP